MNTTEEVIYNSAIVFNVRNTIISFYSEDLDAGLSTVAGIDNTYTDDDDVEYTREDRYYCWNQLPNIETAINLWQEINDYLLLPIEIKQILLDNNLSSY